MPKRTLAAPNNKAVKPAGVGGVFEKCRGGSAGSAPIGCSMVAVNRTTDPAIAAIVRL
jgi:hypothetical protein